MKWNTQKMLEQKPSIILQANGKRYLGTILKNELNQTFPNPLIHSELGILSFHRNAILFSLNHNYPLIID
jgi:hypothetical protein